MITYVRSDLFLSPAQTLVNTVNTVGVMGKGIAKRFKEIYPEMFREYQSLCENRRIEIGTLYLFKSQHKYVLNVPTKKHWRNPSKVEYIEKAMDAFIAMYEDAGITSISFPPLGCGNGELDFESQVRPVMESKLERIPIPVFIHLLDRTDPIPEHRRPDEIREWLRSQPDDLSFWEVWEDLVVLLRHRSEFQTFSTGTQFGVSLINRLPEEGAVEIKTPTKKWKVEIEKIRVLWQQLRTQGFLSSSEAPAGLGHDLSYISPILAELPYVERVRMGDAFDSFVKQPRLGLKLVRPSTGEIDEPSVQADLFADEASNFVVAR